MLGCLGRALFGLIFIAAGVLVAVFFGAHVILTCEWIEPRSGRCELVTENLLGANRRTIRAEDIRTATVEVSEDSDGDDTYRVALETTQGVIPLTDFYSSGFSDKQRITEQINAFLADGDAPTLIVDQDERLFAYTFGACFSVIGLIVWLTAFTAPFQRLLRGSVRPRA